jgi:hypothetical protein
MLGSAIQRHRASWPAAFSARPPKLLGRKEHSSRADSEADEHPPASAKATAWPPKLHAKAAGRDWRLFEREFSSASSRKRLHRPRMLHRRYSFGGLAEAFAKAVDRRDEMIFSGE